MTFRWTKAAKAQLAEMLEQGLSASEIGARLDISRNAVIGAVHRDPALRTIGLRGKPGNASGGRVPYPKPEPKPASTDRERRAAGVSCVIDAGATQGGSMKLAARSPMFHCEAKQVSE